MEQTAGSDGLSLGGEPELIRALECAIALDSQGREGRPLAVYCARRRVDRGALTFAREKFRAGIPLLFVAVEWGVAFVGPWVAVGDRTACLECAARRLGAEPTPAWDSPPPAELVPLPALGAALAALEIRRFRAGRTPTLGGAQLLLNPQPEAALLRLPAWDRITFLPVPDCPTCGSGTRPERLRPFTGWRLVRPEGRTTS